MSPQFPKYRYSLDVDDRVLTVDERWLAFARENGAAELTREAVLGRSLWDYVQGEPIRQFYEAVFGVVRSSGKTAVLPFRCDSPTLKREMRLEISTGSSGILNLEGVLYQVEPTQYVRLLESGVRRSGQRLTVCSICRRAMIEPSGWMELSDAASRLHIAEQARVPTLTEVVCPTCASFVTSAMN